MPTTKPTILVSAVGAPPGFNTLTQLAASGDYNIIATDADRLSPGLYEFAQLGVEHAVLPAASAPDYLDALCAVIKKHNVTAMIPCIEDEVRMLANNREPLVDLGCALLLPEGEAINRAINKDTCTTMVQDAGLPCPGSVQISMETEDESRKVLKDFEARYPAPWICKPQTGYGMRGIRQVVGIEDAMAHAREVGGPMQVQELIPGKLGSVYMVGMLYDTSGTLRRRFLARSFRTLYPEGGPAISGISVVNPELLDMTTQALEVIGPWQGPAGVEWMLDPRDNTFKFIEINARLWGYSSLAPGAGAPFHRLTAELALGNDIGEDPGYREGVVMMRSFKDVIYETCPIEGIRP